MPQNHLEHTDHGIQFYIFVEKFDELSKAFQQDSADEMDFDYLA